MSTSVVIRAIVAISASLATTAFAGAALTSGHVVAVRVDAGGMGIIWFDQPLVGSNATCTQPGYQNALAFNATTGKGVLAMALSAKATGSPVEVYGAGTCGVYGVVEDIAYGVIH